MKVENKTAECIAAIHQEWYRVELFKVTSKVYILEVSISKPLQAETFDNVYDALKAFAASATILAGEYFAN
ncbi:MAG: hypothetical protein WC748_09920 [Legionellales bacterium]